MNRRTRSQVFEELVNSIKEYRLIGRGQLSMNILTNPDLFEECIEAMKETGMIKTSYVFTKSGRQKEILEAANLDNSELYIKALSKVVAPTLRELFDSWYASRHQPSDTRTAEELEKEKENKRAFNLVKQCFSSERAREEV